MVTFLPSRLHLIIKATLESRSTSIEETVSTQTVSLLTSFCLDQEIEYLHQ